MRYIKPKYHKKQLRKLGRQRFADGLLVGYLVACVAVLFISNDEATK